MTVLKFAVLRHTRAKDGSYKIRLAIGHQSQTHYIVTPYKVSNPTDLVNGVVVRGTNSTEINLHLSQMLADYNSRLSRIPNPDQYTCTQLRTILLSMRPSQSDATFLSVANEYAQELTLSNRQTYARMIGYISRGFSEFMHGDVFLSTISPLCPTPCIPSPLPSCRCHRSASSTSPSATSAGYAMPRYGTMTAESTVTCSYSPTIWVV